MFRCGYVDRLLKDAGISHSALARYLKTDRYQVSRWLNDKRQPRASTIIKIAKLLDKSFEDLFEVPAEVAREGERKRSRRSVIPILGYTFTTLDDEPLAADGNAGLSGGAIGEIEEPLADEEAFAIEVRGDSMEPGIQDGWRVVTSPRECFVIDHAEIRPLIRNRIYYIRDNQDRRHIKRVRRIGALFSLESFNQSYNTFELPAEHVRDIFGILFIVPKQ